jgi:hypothetical protein
MLAACPSLTPCGLSLGPTHPGWINLAQETLGLRRLRFSRSLSLLIPTFSLLLRPAHLIDAPSTYRRTLPYPSTSPKADESHSVGSMLEPRSL